MASGVYHGGTVVGVRVGLIVRVNRNRNRNRSRNANLSSRIHYRPGHPSLVFKTRTLRNT